MLEKEQSFDPVVARVSMRQLFEHCALTKEEIDILILRFAYEWFYEDIGEYVGIKYRGKPYREGTIRYKLRKSREAIGDFLENNPQ